MLIGSTTESIFKLLGLFVMFIALIVGCYYTTKFVGSRQLGKMKNSNIKVIETFRVNQNKFLQIVCVGSKYILIAVCKDSITMLTELSKDDITIAQSVGNDKGFKEVLSLFMKKQTGQTEQTDSIDKSGE